MGPFVSKYINFAFKIFLLRRQEFFDFSVDFFDNFGPPESQRVIKWKSSVINSQIVSKHIPYDLNISSKVKQRVLGTIKIWRKCPSTEALWGGGRGGRLTSLDASFARCFAFWRTSSKTSTSMFFQKNRQNIASLRKKHDVLHDVLGFRNSTQSYDKSLVT